VALNTKTRKTSGPAGRDTKRGADKAAAPTAAPVPERIDQHVVAWFKAKPAERVPLAAMAGVYSTGAAVHAIHAAPNGVIAATAVAMFGIAASRRIKDSTRAFKTYALAAASGLWVTVADATGVVGPHYAMTAGFGVMSGVAYFMYRRDDHIKSRIKARKQREAWPAFAAAVGLNGSVVEKREDTRLGERLIVNIKGTGKRASAIANGDVAVRIAEHYRIAKSRVTVKEIARDATLVSISIRRVDPWAKPIKHPLLDTDPEITLSVPNDITKGPLIVGQDPETGDPLNLSVWDEDGARRTMIVAALGGGKTVFLNNTIERITACDNAIVWGIDLTKAKDLREWRKGGAVPVAACGPEEKGKAALILKLARAAINYRALNNRESVFQPGWGRPGITIVLDEIDGLVGGNSAMAQAAREDLTYIVSKGRSESIGVIIVGQRGTAKWLGGADLRALLEQVVLLKVNRPNEVHLATGGVDLNLPDMTTYGEGKAGVALICGMDGSHDAGRTFKFSDLDDILRISSSRTPSPLEPGLVEHLGDAYTQLIDAPAATATATDTTTETVARLDAEVEASMPEDLREQWQKRNAKLDEVRKYVENMPTVEHDPRVEDIVRERQRQFVEQAKAAGVPADARAKILDLAGGADGAKNQALVDALKVSRVTVFRYLTALGAEGIVEKRGRGPATAWHLVTDGEDHRLD
jgi:hypothetical protein